MRSLPEMHVITKNQIGSRKISANIHVGSVHGKPLIMPAALVYGAPQSVVYKWTLAEIGGLFALVLGAQQILSKSTGLRNVPRSQRESKTRETSNTITARLQSGGQVDVEGEGRGGS
jgi:hypothetical protein